MNLVLRVRQDFPEVTFVGRPEDVLAQRDGVEGRVSEKVKVEKVMCI